MADAAFRFQQPGAGQFYYQQHLNTHQRHLARNGNASPNGRIKLAKDTPSPSRSPPLTQSPAAFSMYNQAHQRQHVLMNGGQGHGGFQMQLPKFQHQNHHPHHAQQQQHHGHHPQNQASHAALAGHQHNFSGSGLQSSTPQFTASHIPNGAPGGVEDDVDEPANEHWQLQLRLAQDSRQANSPHHHARNSGQTLKPTSLLQNDNDDRTSKKQPWTGLDLGGQGLRSLTPAIFNYMFLDKLYLPHNKLQSIPAGIGMLKNLQILDLSSNQLTELPSEIGMLTKLRKLLVFHNGLQTLPFELGYLYQLEILGIEGNPIDGAMKSKLMHDGTQALVKELLENMPVRLPPDNRDWIVLDDSAPSGQGSDKFSVLSYNILCERSGKPSQFGYASNRMLDWPTRRDMILNEIRSHDADIVSLQEVDQGNYNEFFRSQLAYNDYKGVYWPKGRAERMHEDEAKLVDGCAIFYKNSKYILLEKKRLHFGQLAVARPDSKGQDDIYNRVWQKDHIAVVAFLENRLTGSRLIVADTHMEWDPAFNDVKLVQTAIMMDELTRMADEYAKYPPVKDKQAFRFADAGEAADADAPVVQPAPSAHYSSGAQIPMLICGDFNSDATSSVVELITNGGISKQHPDFEDRKYGNLSREGMSHPFTLKSAYSGIGELPFTNYTAAFVSPIDFIWYSPNTLQVTGLLGEIDKEYLKRVPGFPNDHFPSDHIALVAEFSVKGKKGKVVEANFGPSTHRDRDRDRVT